MHCKACDKSLTEKELTWNDDLKDWELCTECLDAALDAAYSNGFKIDDDEIEQVEFEFDEDAYAEFNHYGERTDGE